MNSEEIAIKYHFIFQNIFYQLLYINIIINDLEKESMIAYNKKNYYI